MWNKALPDEVGHGVSNEEFSVGLDPGLARLVESLAGFDVRAPSRDVALRSVRFRGDSELRFSFFGLF